MTIPTTGNGTAGVSSYPENPNYHYSSGGTPSAQGYAGGQNPSVASYVQQLHQYHQMYQAILKQLGPNDPRRAQIMKYETILNQYLAQVGAGSVDTGMDPYGMGGGMGMDPYGMGIPGGDLGGTPPMGPTDKSGQPLKREQDSNHILFEEGATSMNVVTKDDTEKRQLDFYQKENLLQVPSNAATVKVQSMADDAVPGKTMLVVTIKFPGGLTRKVVYHNASREDFKLRVESADKGQIQLDATVTNDADMAKKIIQAGIGEVPEAPKGTPPDKTEKDSRTWNTKDKVDYFVTKGTETDKIYADLVNVTLPDRSHKAYVTKTGDHDYTIEIKNEKGETIRKIEAHQVDLLNLDGVDGDNVFFQDKTGKGKHTSATPAPSTPTKPKPKPGSGSKFDVLVSKEFNPGYILGGDDFKKWSDPACDTDDQFTVGSKSNNTGAGKAGQAVSAKHKDDTAADEVSGDTAKYNTKNDVKIHADFDDGVTKQNVTTSGPVTLYASSFDNEVKIYKINNEYTVEMISNGKKETFILKGPPSKITIEGVVESKVKYITPDGVGGMNTENYRAGIDNLIAVSGEKAAPPPPMPWPATAVVSNVPAGGHNTNEALELAQKMEQAGTSGNWGDVTNYLNTKDMGGDGWGKWNNTIRKVMTGLFRSVGGDPGKFKALLKLIPNHVRDRMKELVLAGGREMDETQSGDQWHSAGTAAQIDASFLP